MKREDLRLLNCDANCDHSFPVSDADLAALGYVRLDVDEGREAALKALGMRRVAASELGVRWVADGYVLPIPENYPKGPKWIDTDEPIGLGNFMTVVVEREATGGDLWVLAALDGEET